MICFLVIGMFSDIYAATIERVLVEGVISVSSAPEALHNELLYELENKLGKYFQFV